MLDRTFKCQYCGKLFSTDIPCYMHESECPKNPQAANLRGSKVLKKTTNEKINVPNSLIEKKSSYKSNVQFQG